MNFVILAGGSGTRLWPMSRSSAPKQLAKLVSSATMIEDTIARLEGSADHTNLYISTNAQFAPLIQELMPAIPKDHYIIEPAKRDTGPAMAYVASFMAQIAPDEPMVFVPSDHYIKDPKRYREIFAAADAVVRSSGKLISVGIQPTFPSPLLGYLKFGEKLFQQDGVNVHQFQGQVEKPDEATAQQFLNEGTYLWNANYFTWTPRGFIEAYTTYANDGIGQYLDELGKAIASSDNDHVSALYNKMEMISIDYAVMEKIDRDKVYTIIGDFGWADLGSWDMLYEELAGQHDEHGNLIKAHWHGLDTTRSLIYAPEGKVVSTLGLDEVVVVDTPDALLVTTKQRARDLKKIVELLKQHGAEHVL